MKRILSALIAVILATGIAWAITGYNRSETSKEITINKQYETMEDTTITLEAPNEATEGGIIEVSGRLTDSEGNGLANKTIFVRWYGSFDMSPTFITNSEGRFQGEKDVPTYCKDKEILTATFAGD